MPLVGTWIEIFEGEYDDFGLLVVPLVGTWIEMLMDPTIPQGSTVVPLVGTWIEILLRSFCCLLRTSCPSWARGLK